MNFRANTMNLLMHAAGTYKGNDTARVFLDVHSVHESKRQKFRPLMLATSKGDVWPIPVCFLPRVL